MQVREIMSSDVEVIPPDTSIQDAAVRMRGADVGALPVGTKDQLIGMVTDRDIVVRGVAEGKADGNATIGDVLTGDLTFCFEEDDVDDAANLMADRQVRRLPVLNADKQLVGMLALADISRLDVDAGGAALGDISQSSDEQQAG
ncbi:MAG TPA: CBS domain-containing protein [Sphingomicrobium sp.]|jgi:CBS domain-containing protein